MLERAIRLVTLAALAAAVVFVLARVDALGQERFFTIDEYQYGHATWLVSQGERPYVDFYEHHLPLAYVAHAPLVAGDDGFVERALRLRRVPTAYMLLLAAVLALAVGATTASPHAALLAACLPLAFGFSLLSAVDYRADNFGAFLWLACLALLDANRGWRSAAVAAACGALAALAALMTQKALALAGITLACLAGVDWLRRHGEHARMLQRPVALVAGAGLVLAFALAAGALTGLLPAAFEITFLQAIRHESTYPSDPVWPFVAPFLAATAWTTLPIAGFAAVFLVGARSGFWSIALGIALVLGALVAGRYPYNYVFLCQAVTLCSVRGIAWAAEPLRRRLGALHPLLYLLPLALLPDQLAFAGGRSSNEHQLRLLEKVERFTGPDDVVIDSAGGALFRPHASYYWYHGLAHREMFADYFDGELVEDYRRSAAPLWIEDGRLHQLPEAVLDYFRSHYVRADGSLHALGFLLPETDRGRAQQLEIDVIRAGEYQILPLARPLQGGRSGGIAIDGSRVEGTSVRLEPGRHRVTVLPNTPPTVVSLLPRVFFQDKVTGNADHSLLFEYD